MNHIKPKVMLDQRKEKRNKVLMLIFCAAFFLIVFATQGQTVQRFNDIVDGKHYVAKIPSHPLEFNLLNDYKDTLSLWVVADSIGNNVYLIRLLSKYTKGLRPPENFIKVWYKDGSLDEFKPFAFNKTDRTVNYNIVGNSLSNMFHKEILAIDFSPTMYCEWIGEKKYFIDFFAKYDK